MQSFQPVHAKADQLKVEPRLQDLFQDIQSQLQHINITQYQATDCISKMDDQVSRMEKLLQQMQQVDMPRSTVKDPAPVSSSDG